MDQRLALYPAVVRRRARFLAITSAVSPAPLSKKRLTVARAVPSMNTRIVPSGSFTGLGAAWRRYRRRKALSPISEALSDTAIPEFGVSELLRSFAAPLPAPALSGSSTGLRCTAKIIPSPASAPLTRRDGGFVGKLKADGYGREGGDGFKHEDGQRQRLGFFCIFLHCFVPVSASYGKSETTAALINLVGTNLISIIFILQLQ